MRHKRLKLIAVILLGLGLPGLQAQETLLTSGGDASGSNGKTSYSVGQVVYRTYAGTNGSIANGGQQPYEISVITGIKETPGIDLAVSVYPNPTANSLKLELGEFDYSTLTIHLFDMNGKILENRKPDNHTTNIDMSKLAPAVYFLTIKQNEKEIKAFKIIKK